MLTELYRYALDKGLAAQPGFKPKRVKAYVLLSASGEFLGIHTREKDAPAVYAPDIGAAANGTRYCNPLIEKAKIPLRMVEDPKGDQNVPTKHDFFLSMLDDGGDCEPAFSVVAQALRDGATVQTIEQRSHWIYGGRSSAGSQLPVPALVDEVSGDVLAGGSRRPPQVPHYR